VRDFTIGLNLVSQSFPLENDTYLLALGLGSEQLQYSSLVDRPATRLQRHYCFAQEMSSSCQGLDVGGPTTVRHIYTPLFQLCLIFSSNHVGVPRILEDTLPNHLAELPLEHPEGKDWMDYAQYMHNTRINVNVRQVFPKGFDPGLGVGT
jgi:hypothetical protein